ncbi:hypothetical protein DAI22_12g144300 [Oryza sativa Japonica Group]|nr:hypothetical protein DAI22_12g144300 [Oryza sativa Japonica Group]
MKRRGWHLASICHLCSRGEETLLTSFKVVLTHKKCASIRGWLGLCCSTPMESLPSWWCDARKAIKKRDRRAFDAGIILVTWLIWKQRNARVFEGHTVLPVNLCAAIEDEWKLWQEAGLTSSL